MNNLRGGLATEAWLGALSRRCAPPRYKLVVVKTVLKGRVERLHPQPSYIKRDKYGLPAPKKEKDSDHPSHLLDPSTSVDQGSLRCMKITQGIPGVYDDHPRDPWGV